MTQQDESWTRPMMEAHAALLGWEPALLDEKPGVWQPSTDHGIWVTIVIKKRFAVVINRASEAYLVTLGRPWAAIPDLDLEAIFNRIMERQNEYPSTT